jgi:hypothetical protein
MLLVYGRLNWVAILATIEAHEVQIGIVALSFSFSLINNRTVFAASSY